LTAQGGALSAARAQAATAQMGNQAVVSGGYGLDGQPLESVEVFDSLSLSFVAAEPMMFPRARHTATVLPDGRVLFVGGAGPGAGTWELWSPTDGVVDSGELAEARWNHRATLLGPAGGESWSPLVAITGGEHTEQASAGVRSTMELFETAQAALAPSLEKLCPEKTADGLVGTPKTLHAAPAVDGSLYVMGGYSDAAHENASDHICIWKAKTRTWILAVGALSLSVPRADHEAVVTRSPGETRVTVIGGAICGESPAGCASWVDQFIETSGSRGVHHRDFTSFESPMVAHRWGHHGVPTCGGRILVVGGVAGETRASASPTAITELFNPWR